MTIGIIILAHQHLHRTRQLAKTLASRNVRVVIHVDADTDDRAFNGLKQSLAKNVNVAFADRVSCEWGAFSLVRAGMDAADYLLKKWPGVTHVAQISGSCLPIRPIEDLCAFLDDNIGCDFVESYCAKDSNWVVGGLSHERFTLYFPFSWRRQRWLFDRAVDLQRAMGMRRTVPLGLQPHVGSQWWCLSSATLRAILTDPNRADIDRYFKRCWIPDEGYIPTLVRRHSKNLVATSLTLSRFDEQGKPHLFYDDHGDLLEQSDQFFARKIWQGADGLYRRFLTQKHKTRVRNVADDLGLNNLFSQAYDRRCKGRDGRLNVGRFPAAAHARQPASCCKYGVLIGAGHVFQDAQAWLDAQTSGVFHGRLYKQNAVQFGNVDQTTLGAIPANPKVRDANPEQFLCNMLWNGRGDHQSWMLELSDSERMAQFVANDPNAAPVFLRGGWVLELLARPNQDRRTIKTQARRLAAMERRLERELQKTGRSDVVYVDFKNMIVNPGDELAKICAALGTELDRTRSVAPQFRDLSRLRTFMADLNAMGADTSQLGPLPKFLPGEPQFIGCDALFAIG